MNDNFLEWLYQNSPTFKEVADRLGARKVDLEKTVRELELSERLGLPINIAKTK